MSRAIPSGGRGAAVAATAALAALLTVGSLAAARVPTAGTRAVTTAVTARSGAAATPAKPAAGEGVDAAQISLWLRPVARLLHVPTSALWTTAYWINFLLLAYFLYFLLIKLKLPQIMRDRTRTVGRRLAEAEAAQRDANERLRSIERRLEGLGQEVVGLRDQAVAEAEAEFRRLAAEAKAEAEMVGALAGRQIEAAAKTARQELRRFAGELAVVVAERRLRRQMTPEMDRRVVREGLAAVRGGEQ